MELRHLRYFLVLAEELHFGRAAKKLFISQPPLSRQIKQLEESLGVTLFKRNNKKVELTTYGNYLKKESEKIFADLLQVQKNLELMKATDVGKISIGYVGAVMYSFLPEVLKELKVRFPKAYFILKELDNASQIDALHKNIIDIGFVRGPLQLNDLESQKIESSTFSIVLSKSHPLAQKQNLTLMDLQNESFISFSRQCAPPMYNSIKSLFQKNGIEPFIVHETTQINALLRLVESGFGYSIVPTNINEGHNSGIVFHELNQYDEKTEVSLIYNNRFLTNLVNNTIKSIVEIVDSL